MTGLDVAIAALLVGVTYLVGHRVGFGKHRELVEAVLQDIARKAEVDGDSSLVRACRRLRARLYVPPNRKILP